MSETIRPSRSWNRVEYDCAAAAGAFGPEARIELIDGELLAMSPQGSRHATAVRLVEDALRRTFGIGYDVRAQLPLALDDRSEPEPDVAVVEGRARDYRDAHPTTAVLIVEVAEDSLTRDRTAKQRLYARCGIPEYWILVLPTTALEVYHDLGANGYGAMTIYRPGDKVSPLACPAARVAIDDLLP